MNSLYIRKGGFAIASSKEIWKKQVKFSIKISKKWFLLKNGIAILGKMYYDNLTKTFK